MGPDRVKILPSGMCLWILVVVVIASPFASSLTFSEIQNAAHHLSATAPKSSVESLANARIPRRDGGEVLAYCTGEHKTGRHDLPTLILIHEFFGLSQSICDKADALAEECSCFVVAPDTFRGEASTFIPKCIWLALSTPQERVNDDLDDVLQWVDCRADTSRLVVMGFCYGGGKAIRYTCERKNEAATIVCYGSPLSDVQQLKKLRKPVCGVFGSLDVQFPPPVLEKFRSALQQANVDSNIQVYDGVGHAFWSDMDQIREEKQPQLDAYRQITAFIKKETAS